MEKNGSRIKNALQDYFLPLILFAGLVALMAIFKDQHLGDHAPLIPQEHKIDLVVGYIIIAVEIATALVILIGLLRATISYICLQFTRVEHQTTSLTHIRAHLAHVLILGLEFAIASEILRLAIAPNTAEIMILFTKVLLRSLLNFILEREIQTCETPDSAGNLISQQTNPDEPGH